MMATSLNESRKMPLCCEDCAVKSAQSIHWQRPSTCEAGSDQDEVERSESDDALLSNASSESSHNHDRRKYVRTLLLTLALVLTYSVSFGSHYETHLFGTLKSDIKERLDLSNLAFHSLSVVIALPNTILPFLVGLFVDSCGSTIGSLMASTLIASGTLMSSFGIWQNSFVAVLCGRFLYGIGAGCIVVVQESILTHWFRGRHLALAVGCQIALSRLSTYVALSISVPIREATSLTIAVFVSALLCTFCLGLNVIYVLCIRWLNDNELDSATRVNENSSRPRPSLRSLRYGIIVSLPISYWFVIGHALLLTACWNPFIEITSDYLKSQFPENDWTVWSQRGLNGLLLPVLLSTATGWFVDRYSHWRPILAIAASFCALVAFCLLNWTLLPPWIALLLFSLSLTVGPVAMLSTVPLVLPATLTATGYGLYKCSLNVGSALSHQVIGSLQDSQQNRYENVMLWLIAVSATSLVTGVGIQFAPEYHQERNSPIFSSKICAMSFLVLLFVCWILFIGSLIRDTV